MDSVYQTTLIIVESSIYLITLYVEPVSQDSSWILQRLNVCLVHLLTSTV